MLRERWAQFPFCERSVLKSRLLEAMLQRNLSSPYTGDKIIVAFNPRLLP
jgi:hypothetical protein